MSRIYNCTNHDLKIPNIIESNGVYLRDDEDNRYMDLESGVWCTSLGHNNPKINELLKQQAGVLMHAGFCYSSEIVEESAYSVQSITEFKNGKCVYLCSGSEAIELARQISRHLSRRNLSMTLHDSYLGSYSSVTDRSENWYIFNWEECEECPCKINCDVSCKKLQDIPETVSEFIFEPGSSSGFVRFPPKALIQNIITKVKSQGGKIIANEVTTGIGRTGKWFGYNHYQIEPDLVAIGKSIGNGYPVSVTVINEQTARELEKSTFRYMQSHQNDPLGAAIANEVIKVIKNEKLISKADENGKKFLKMLESIKDDHYISDIRGRGLMFAVDICNENTSEQLFNKLLNQGYILCNRKTLFRIDPPLIITENEFEKFTFDFKLILESLRKA